MTRRPFGKSGPATWILLLVMGGSLLAAMLKQSPPLSSTGENGPTRILEERVQELGTFEVATSHFIISDPSYSQEIVDQGLGLRVNGVMQGLWNGYSLQRRFSDIPHRLFASELLFLNASQSDPHALTWKETGQIGVDAGTAGIFMEEAFQQFSLVPEHWSLPEIPEQYLKLMNLTQEQYAASLGWSDYVLSKVGASEAVLIEDIGLLSSAGYGDGAYSVFCARDEQGRLLGVKIIFIDAEGNG